MRIEHIALNVRDPIAMAAWYCEHLGMAVVREGPPPANARFLADATGYVILEIYCNPPDAVPDYAGMDPLLLHIAFAVEDLDGARATLLGAGAAAVGAVNRLPSGDQIAMLRDPWGVAVQLVRRAAPMAKPL